MDDTLLADDTSPPLPQPLSEDVCRICMCPATEDAESGGPLLRPWLRHRWDLPVTLWVVTAPSRTVEAAP